MATTATVNDRGTIRVRCPGCFGALSSYEWYPDGKVLGAVMQEVASPQYGRVFKHYRLFRCAGCGMGGLGTIVSGRSEYPLGLIEVEAFFPETADVLDLPPGTPAGIVAEFREGEKCLGAGAFRAAAAMFRSVLDKTLRDNGYKERKGTTLEQQIEKASDEGVITKARSKRAHEEIRVLGNDVMHEEWRELNRDDVELARHYSQRILEDFYDDRATILALLSAAGRIRDEGQQKAPPCS